MIMPRESVVLSDGLPSDLFITKMRSLTSSSLPSGTSNLSGANIPDTRYKRGTGETAINKPSA